MFHVSKEVDQNGECKYQTLISSKKGTFYLLKLYSQQIVVVSFSESKESFEMKTSKIVEI